MGSVPLNVAFRRALVGQNLVYWHELCASIVHIQLNRSSDCFRWNYHKNGRFSVIFRATHWLRFWAQLQRCDEDGEFLKVACRKLETMVMQLYANYG
uniref:Uncharacterized protein n=2 Tax=Oryza sativa subsp. japonica TaxID=39947 RepID=Q53JV1_ORYSJ|nr:hypothetical protein LOC_Os11g22970 [Oryza sativa Japonica Group]ABA93084.1 hypothetical protein LOC_Os11g22970 [Oryza sativa Japonica Group]